MLNVPDLRVIVLATTEWIGRMRDELARRPWITPIPAAPPHDIRTAFAAMRSMGIARISAIGGRTIAGVLTNAGVVQDLYLTTSPRPGGEPDTPLHPGTIAGTLAVRKHGTGKERGVMFEHMVI
jgi:riboflavin biosynthesis pyrimidine reductase